MRILIDMNLSPEWVSVFKAVGHEAVHWSRVGDPGAPDKEILSWARSHGYAIFTHDLDFGAILAATKANAPSVLQVRTQDVTPQRISHLVLSALSQFQPLLNKGALISVDEDSLRARLLPLTE